MLKRTYWIVPGQIIVHEVVGEVMLQDVRDLIQKMGSMIDTESDAEHIDVLLDVTQVTSYHPDTMNIAKLFSAVQKHERIRWNIIINPNPNPVVDFVIRTVSQVFRKSLRIVPTLDDALVFIETKTVSGPQ